MGLERLRALTGLQPGRPDDRERSGRSSCSTRWTAPPREAYGAHMYDYVIVGAGSAGCVVAHRLGEDPDVKVAVIEAGPPDDAPEIHMPLAFGPNLTSDWDWALFSEPEPGLD